VGVPVYQGARLVGKALECLQQQTFKNFEVVISVDGNDTETAAACRPFLADRRFRMIVQPERLDWVGNFNWLLQQDLKEFFCYRQHDDTTAPSFFESLLEVADKRPNAATIYCDCEHTHGDHKWVGKTFSVMGDPFARMLQYIERIPDMPLRGLIRTAAIRQAGLVRADEFRGPHQHYGWLAKLVRWGEFIRLPQPLYYRLSHGDSYTADFMRKQDRMRRAWATISTALLDAAMPLSRTAQERLLFQQAILYRAVANPTFRPVNEVYSAKKLIDECLERIKAEGNSELLQDQEIPMVLKALGSLDEARAPSRIRRGCFQLRQRWMLAKISHPKHIKRRIWYVFQLIGGMLRREIAVS